jgi:hypothetical protein
VGNPGQGAQTEIFELTCDNGGVYVVAVAPGQWAAGRVIEVVRGPSANVLIPFSFEFPFTPTEGEPETFEVSKPGPGPNELVTCTFEGEDEEGTFSGVVEVMVR